MGNKLPQKSGENISLKEAKDLAGAFQKKFKTSNKATYYTRDVFERLLSLPGCVGIRVYPGMDGDKFAPLLVAVDANGDNIYHDTNVVKMAVSETALSSVEEKGSACPPYCASNDFI